MSGGSTVKTDDDGSAHWQYVKAAFGADNTQTRVTASVGLPVLLLAGSDAIGKLAANSGVDIGDVDILSIAAGNNNIGNVDIVTVPAPLSVVGGGTEAAALRVTLANDSTGLLTVDTAGTSGLEVVQATAADLNVTEADAGAIKTAVELLDNAVDGNFLNVNANIAGTDFVGGAGAVAAGVQRTTLASDDPAVVALQIMDDWDAVHASASSSDGAQIMGAGYSTGLPTDIGADADAARICTDRFGRILAGLMPQAFQATISSADATSATQVKAKTASRKMYILSIIASTDTAMDLQFQDDTGPTVLIENIHLAANGGFVANFPPEAPLTVNTNEDFDVLASASGNISVTITGYLAV